MTLTQGASVRGQAVAAGNGVTAGELVIEPATLINLGFEWFIDGDANRNAAVAVSFRKRGDTEWRPALPLLRKDFLVRTIWANSCRKHLQRLKHKHEIPFGPDARGRRSERIRFVAEFPREQGGQCRQDDPPSRQQHRKTRELHRVSPNVSQTPDKFFLSLR